MVSRSHNKTINWFLYGTILCFFYDLHVWSSRAPWVSRYTLKYTCRHLSSSYVILVMLLLVIVTSSEYFLLCPLSLNFSRHCWELRTTEGSLFDFFFNFFWINSKLIFNVFSYFDNCRFRFLVITFSHAYRRAYPGTVQSLEWYPCIIVPFQLFRFLNALRFFEWLTLSFVLDGNENFRMLCGFQEKAAHWCKLVPGMWNRDLSAQVWSVFTQFQVWVEVETHWKKWQLFQRIRI